MKDPLPHQIQTLIESLLDKRESVYIRANYRNRVVAIQRAVNEALEKFDSEYVKQSEHVRVKRK